MAVALPLIIEKRLACSSLLIKSAYSLIMRAVKRALNSYSMVFTTKEKTMKNALKMLGMLYAHCADLLGKGRKAALAVIKLHCKGNRKKWQALVVEFRKAQGYSKLSTLDKERFNNNLRYLRCIVGIKARKRMVKAKVKLEKPSDSDSDSDSAKVILPALGKMTDKVKMQLARQVLTALDSAYGCQRSETFDLLLRVQVEDNAKLGNVKSADAVKPIEKQSKKVA
jgi:hypothetical protein